MKTIVIDIEMTNSGRPAAWEHIGESGSVHLWGGPDGEKVHAYFVPNFGAPQRHALLPIKTGSLLINLCPSSDTGSVDGSICRVTKIDTVALKAALDVIAVHRAGLWIGLSEFGGGVPDGVFSMVTAANEKRACVDCRHAHYAIPRK
jgi:hypothetical protein